MPWNLVDATSKSAPARRHWFLPLASIPVGQTNVRAIDRTLYTFTETYSVLAQPDGRTSDVSLNVKIQIPAGGLVDEAGYPDPLIRVHAIDESRISFEPAADGRQDRLVLEMLTFAFYRTALVSGMPGWFGRWEDAQSVPTKVVYENVDRAQVEALLNGVAAPVDVSLENRVEPTGGLRFPVEIIQSNKAQFIMRFLAGTPDHSIYADAGAVIGAAATDPMDNTRRLLMLHALYQDHTTDNPHPMNPRELFHLIFGDDSVEAVNHPLLVRLNELGGTTQGTVHPESKRFLIRPPLRTWKRVEWEANQEINNHSNNWTPSGSLGADRFYNNHSRVVGVVTRTFNPATFAGSNKCNLFSADISIRAGFAACVHPVDANRWHYLDANSNANRIQRVTGTVGRVAATGVSDDAARTWAWRIENDVRNQAAGSRQQFLNDKMQQEGRCLILAGARGRRFSNYTIVAGVNGIASCETALRRNGIGHIVIVREVLAQPNMTAPVGNGFHGINVDTWQASGSGAVHVNYNAQLGGIAAAAAGGGGFVSLHLFELQPGGDPDTVQGLRTLNVQNVNLNLLGTLNEAAADKRITHDADGDPLPAPPEPGNCCHDNHPPSNAATTTVPC